MKAMSRVEASLGMLTRKFRKILNEGEEFATDLNDAAIALGVQKRRIYDITNVLEGLVSPPVPPF